MCDQIGKFKGYYVSKQYPEKIRRVKFYDAEFNRTFVFLTNNLELTAEQIALLYKNRWQVELFFKWIKQHLKINFFFGGTSENTVRIQIFCAIIAYCLVAIMDMILELIFLPTKITDIRHLSTGQTAVKELFANVDYKDVKELNYNQLEISFI
jgi:transposase